MATTDSTSDFEALARRYWDAWGASMREGGASGAAPSGQQAWQDGLDQWTRFVRGQQADAAAAMERFDALARDWYGTMRQFAEGFAGQDASAGDIAAAWRQALGGSGGHPFAALFQAMRGQGQQGLDAWTEAAAPMLRAWQEEGVSWLRMPAFGFAREHQERWQALAAAQVEYQRRSADYQALMLASGERAFEVFEARLAARAASGERLSSARALFDLWIDAAEEAYAEVALSPAFREAYGALVDAQMRVRAGVQGEVERLAAQFGMPTRTEVDGAHRKIAELERQVRRLRDAMPTGGGDVPSSRPATHRENSTMGKSSPSASSSSTKPARASSTRVADGSNKLAGDPITGPRRGAAAPARRAAPKAPVKAGPERAVDGKPASSPATRKPASKAASKAAPKAASKAASKPLSKAAPKRAPKAASKAAPKPARGKRR